MRHACVAILCITLLSLGSVWPVPCLDGQAAAESGSGQVKALLLISAPYGGNYNLLRDVMDIFGWETTTVGVTPVVNQCFYGGPMTVDSLVTQITDVWKYDCLIIMPANGSGGHQQLLNSPEAVALVQQAVADTLLVGAFCSGTRVLAAAGVIDSVLVTGTPEFLQEYLDAGAIWAGDPVPPVLDGNILTSRRGQYYCYDVVELMRTAIDSLRAVRAGQ